MAVNVYLQFEGDTGTLELEGLDEPGRLIIDQTLPPPPPLLTGLWYPSGVSGVGPGYDLEHVVSFAPAANDPNTVLVRFEIAYQGDATYHFRVNPPVPFDRVAFERVMSSRAPFAPDCHYAFDGITDYIAIDGDPGLASSQLTLSMWLRTTNVDGVLFVAPADPLQPSLRIQDGRLRFGYVGDGDLVLPAHAATMVNPGGLLDGDWHHVAFVHRADSGVEFYVDGVLFPIVDGDPLISFLAPSPSGLWLGRPVTHVWYEGDVDEVSWWNTVMDAAQVAALYNAGAPGDLREHPLYADLLHWWQLGLGDELPRVFDRMLRLDGYAYGISEAICV